MLPVSQNHTLHRHANPAFFSHKVVAYRLPPHSSLTYNLRGLTELCAMLERGPVELSASKLLQLSASNFV